jgi:hypothetical protein
MLDKKTFTIGVLTLTAAMLLMANILAPHHAEANVTIKDRDYQAVTTHVTVPGGDALYVTDNRTGNMAVFVYDPNRKGLKLVGVKSVTDAFGNVRPGLGNH